MVGQPRRFVLTGKDKKPLAMGEVVPFPASGTDGNCTVEAVLLAPNGAATLLLGSGFEPNEPIAFASTSWDEKVGSTRNADANGAYQSMCCRLSKDMTRETHRSKCHPSTSFHWGAYQEVKAEPKAGP